MKADVTMEVNGQKRSGSVEPRTLLVNFIREGLGLTGTHVGCETTNCGACTVILDGRPIKSCTAFAVQADGSKITTIEGIGTLDELDPVQLAFWEKHGLQCGYCTPGMILVARDLLEKNQDPSEEDVRRALSGNLCRCTGYVKIIESVRYAAKLKRTGGARIRKEQKREPRVPRAERAGEQM